MYSVGLLFTHALEEEYADEDNERASQFHHESIGEEKIGAAASGGRGFRLLALFSPSFVRRPIRPVVFMGGRSDDAGEGFPKIATQRIREDGGIWNPGGNGMTSWRRIDPFWDDNSGLKNRNPRVVKMNENLYITTANLKRIDNNVKITYR